jgi:hypothetical protein
VNWTDIQQWEAAPLQEYAVECENKQRKLQTVGDDLGQRLDSLIGSGHTIKAAKAALRKQIMAIEKEVNFLISSAEIASEGVQGINEVRANADDAKQLANTWRMTIDSSGNVSMDAAEVKRLKKAGKNILDIKYMVDTAQKRVNTALRRAQELVESLSQKVSALDAGTYDNNVHYSASKKVRPSLPPPGASPQEVASWWSSLSDDDKQWMIEQHPDVIGNLEGVDYTSRNQANRIMLPRLQQQAKEELDAYVAKVGPHMNGPELEEFVRLSARVKALDQIDQTLKQEADGVPRYLMQLDPSGPNILAAVSQNNPDDADHIGVIVPGMTTSVAGNGKGGSILDYDDHARVMRESAERAAGHGQKVAMVSFFGYDAPPGVIRASNTDMAQAGAKKLSSFLTGIDAAREHGAGDAHITVAAHSYGSTTAGIAATLVGDGVIDDLVQFGSPGSGVQDVGEFHVPEGHTYVSAAPRVNDMVQGVGPDSSFGKNPAKMDGYKHLSGDVGGIKWTKGPGNILPLPVPDPFGSHSDYFTKDTQANRDIGSVIGGNPPS